MGCWEQFRNVPHTSTNILCALRPALEPPSPHPSSWHLLQDSFLGLGGGGLGGSGLTVPVPERVQLATLQACLMSTGGSQRRCLQPPNPICLHRILGDRVHAVSGCTLAHMWRLHRGEQVGCVIQALSSIHRIVVPFCSLPPHFPLPHLQFSLCLFIPDRSVPDLAIPSVLLPSAPQFLYLSYGGSTTALS